MAPARPAILLGASFAAMWMGISVVAGPGPAALAGLTGTLGASGLFFAVFFATSALGALVGGHAMDRWGRRATLTSAHALAAAGYLVAALGQASGRLAPFIAGLLAFSFAFGVGNLTRGQGATFYPPGQEGKGVALIQVMAAVGAMTGPLLLVAAGALGRPIDVAWFVAPVALALGSALAWSSGPSPPPGVGKTRPLIPWRTLAPAVAVLALVQVAMMSPMSVAGAHLGHTGHGATTIGLALAIHFAGMFAFSPFVGRVADHYGRTATMACGLVLVVAGGAMVAFVGTTAGFLVGLLLVGLGWCFGYIAATVQLGVKTPAHLRSQVLGKADLVVAGCACGMALAAGPILATYGSAGLGIVAVVAGILALAAVVTPATRATPTP